MWIKVTQKDIDRGRLTNPWYCPIARAVRRASRLVSGKRQTISVGGSDCSIGRQNYGLPRRARTFVKRFDNGLPVRPLSFPIRKIA